MSFTSCIFKSVTLALLVLLPCGATAGDDAPQRKCFDYSALPSLPSTAAVECAWGFTGGLAVV